MPTDPENGPPPQLQLRQLLTGNWTTQAIHVAAKLGIAELLKDGPKDCKELARATQTHERSLYRLLRALAGVGIFAEDAELRFTLTPLASCLRKDVPGSQWAAAMMIGEEHYRCWHDLLYSIQTGKTAFEHIYQKPIFDFLETNARAAGIFDQAMTSIHGAETAAMLAVYDFSSVRSLVDVGGGNGSLLAGVLEKFPAMQGTLFDRPDVVRRATESLKTFGIDKRCRGVPGDFFVSVPAGGDAYLLRHILHDWNDDQCRTILRNCRRAMRGQEKLLIVECVVPPGNEPFFGKFLDLNMLVIPGGLERTEAEYRELFAETGFCLTRVVATAMEVSIIEGDPV